MTRVLCLLAFLFVNFPPVALAHDHKHHETPPPAPAPTPEPQPASTSGGHKSHALRNVLIGAGIVYLGYSWGSKNREDNGVKIGVKVKEAP